MSSDRALPDNPLHFIRKCVLENRLLWTYHVTMRMEGRSISRETIRSAVGSYEIIEEYPEDKYLPSYLVFGNSGDRIFHVLFATDVAEGNARVVTAYEPDPSEWTLDLKKRKTS